MRWTPYDGLKSSKNFVHMATEVSIISMHFMNAPYKQPNKSTLHSATNVDILIVRVIITVVRWSILIILVSVVYICGSTCIEAFKRRDDLCYTQTASGCCVI